MKFHGTSMKGPSEEIVAFPRSSLDGKQQDLVFILKAVLDFSEFEAICPNPKPAPMLLPGNIQTFDFKNPKYKAEVEAYGGKKMAWMFLKTIESSPNIEWETIDMKDPETWNNYLQELSPFLTASQIVHLYNRAIMINTVDEEKMEEARNRFLAANRPVALE